MTRRTKGIIGILTIATIALIGLHPETRRAISNFGEPRTSYDFLYFYDFSRDSNGIHPYSVLSGRIILNGTSTPIVRFNIDDEQKIPITLNEAEQLQLSTATTSPDGFAIERGYRPCGMNAQCPFVILRHLESGRGREINLAALEFGGVPRLIGWIVP